MRSVLVFGNINPGSCKSQLACAASDQRCRTMTQILSVSPEVHSQCRCRDLHISQQKCLKTYILAKYLRTLHKLLKIFEHFSYSSSYYFPHCYQQAFSINVFSSLSFPPSTAFQLPLVPPPPNFPTRNLGLKDRS